MSDLLENESWKKVQEEFEKDSDIMELMENILITTPGIAVSVVVGDQVLFSGAKGHIGFVSPDEENVSQFPEVSTDGTAFLIASISKTFLATLCLQCFERGEIDLDSDINHYLTRPDRRYPPIRVSNPSFPSQSITIRHLLTHSSGLCDDESALSVHNRWRTSGRDCPISLYEYVHNRLIPSGREYEESLWSRRSPPGEAAYHYSNAGFTLLGLVVEQVTNMSLNDLAHRDIFDPLGMKNTDYFLSYFNEPVVVAEEEKKIDIAIPYLGENDPITNHYCVAEWPACQIRSTLTDLTSYLLAFTSENPSKLLLSKKCMKVLMPENMTKGLAWWGKDTSYGDKKGRFWDHGGFMDGVRTHIYLFPAEGEQEQEQEQQTEVGSLRRQKKGAIILTNGWGSYEMITCGIIRALKNLP
jgi:CubicO group peptidase (beta-lactamase class C family)